MTELQSLRANELCEMAVLVNKRGLHARAAAKLVQTASAFKAEIYIGREDMRVTATSIMGLMMLAAPCGSCLKLCASGVEAADALNALVDLIRRGFDEE
jgi:phosphocarrier protein